MTESTRPRLQMDGVRKTLGATQALRQVSLTVRPGEILGLIGENGAGKSTLMKILSGALAPDDGKMTLNGARFAPANPLQARKAGIGMIYQELSLAPQLSVLDNMLLGVEPCWGPFLRRTLAGKIVGLALAQVGLQKLSPQTLVERLAPAQQQLVEIARALIPRSNQGVAIDSHNSHEGSASACQVLVFDEPTSSLSRHDVDRLFTLLRSLRSRGVAMIYISHFLEEVRSICDHYLVLRDGQVTGSGEVPDATESQLVTMMVGREVSQLYPHNRRVAGEVVLEAQKIAGKKRPTSASCTLHRGEILGIFGLIGSGRTEFLRILFGLDPSTQGDRRTSRNALLMSSRESWKRGMGMVSEDRKREGLALNLSIADNITLPRLSGLGPLASVLPSRQVRAARPWIERLRIKCRSGRDPVHTLSGGNQQKVALARLLHAEVDILLLDEPTRGVDVGSKEEIYDLLDELVQGGPAPRGQKGSRQACGILMVSSYLPELLGICDRIAVMCRGELSPARPTHEWTADEIMRVATGQGGELG